MHFSGPFVTAVGGTTGIKPETAIYFTGGGFSNYFRQPPYQTKDVTAYIKNLGSTYNGLYKCGLRLLAFGEPPAKSLFAYRIAALRAVGSRMLRLVVTGTEWSWAVTPTISVEPAPALRCDIPETNLLDGPN